MSELLPTQQAARLRAALLDYLTTTFALADGDARLALTEFLDDPVDGIFKGPYIRTRLPFAPAGDDWRRHLSWAPPGFSPYGHQAQAFERLSSMGGRRPQPTLVTTGTGSGKTEAFLVPILDHVLRARREGVTGVKALLLYPMNALANDQAKRLTQLITASPDDGTANPLQGVTAALYTGEAGTTRTTVSAAGLITNRQIIRDDPPDILLTNYKMLDQLLLRHEDQRLWELSADSLTYVVLDEFHTYDGAQGTDVAMLLRRLGIALKSYWPARGSDTDHHHADAWDRPLGNATPVGTSATLGGADGDATEVMAAFASEIFGESFDAYSVVTESRVSLDDWCGQADPRLREGASQQGVSDDVAAAVADAIPDDASGAEITRAVLDALWPDVARTDLDSRQQLDLLRAHPTVRELIAATQQATPIGELAQRLVPVTGNAAPAQREGFVQHLVATLSHLRAVIGRDAVGVEAHLWIRELSRVDRDATGRVSLRWSDDGVLGRTDEVTAPAFPAVFCRHCGRSGWGVELASTGTSLTGDDRSIRRNHAAKEGRFRALIAAQDSETGMDGAPPAEHLLWFHIQHRELGSSRPDPDSDAFRNGLLIPVLGHTGKDADDLSRDDTCPHCQQKDGIRFLGSAIATQLSVCLSSLFGTVGLDENEKKALVFTDSVQDAAHRAGFVTARSHTLTLRGALRHAVTDQPLSLDDLVRQTLSDATTATQRYRLLPLTLATNPELQPWWSGSGKDAYAMRRLAMRVQNRLAFDAAMEVGLMSTVGRTLEQTGSLVVEVDAGPTPAMATLARQAIRHGDEQQDSLDELAEVTDEQAIRWVRGILERMRTQGAIHHPWFDRYIAEGGSRWQIWGGRPSKQDMPAFPSGRAAPAFPRIGGGKSAGYEHLDPVAEARSWYARWTSRALGVSPQHGARLARSLVIRLAQAELITQHTGPGEMAVFSLAPSRVLVRAADDEELAAGAYRLVCPTCRTEKAVSRLTGEQLADGPCLTMTCAGTLHRQPGDPQNFYRRLYASGDLRRVVAREHTSLLADKDRLERETAFKEGSADPSAPNVLVATPTLEMGIDIGDLSTVFLASLPRSVASYLQRVGRAGRRTGNALDVAFVRGRGEHLPRLGDPGSVINGTVRPPATYLSAEEILKRQYLAHLVDAFARDHVDGHHPQRAGGAIGSSEPGTFLGDLIAAAEDDAAAQLDRFLDTFDDLRPETVAELREWATPASWPSSSGLAATVHTAAHAWRKRREDLQHRLDEIDAALPDLRARQEVPSASDDDKRAVRVAEASRKLVAYQLAEGDREYWIGTLESYGLLPNYTLLGDSVTLDVALSWINPENGDYESESGSFDRGSEAALREFAPGATFYVNGLQIPISSVDLGHGRDAVREWALCGECGYAVDVHASGIAAHVPPCPRCGSTGIQDTRQRLNVVELRHVSASVSRDDARIDDSDDNRKDMSFRIVTAADIDPQHAIAPWFAGDSGFGATYLRRLSIRWLNLGRRTAHATSLDVAGQTVPSPLFRVCESCGQVDQTSHANSRDEHKPWCPHRRSAEEHTVSVALMRQLTTQGVVLRLPWTVTTGDSLAVPSLTAALLVGLRERFGGSPDHLGVASVTLPDGNGRAVPALLLHDRVPGGTGYLADLARPENVWRVLRSAWQIVHDCPCEGEGRLACHRCLLPYAGGNLDLVSRANAEQHLTEILGATGGGVPEEMGWAVTEVAPAVDPSDESHLEKRFRALFKTLAQGLGYTVSDIASVGGNIVSARLGGVEWRLRPQVDLPGCRPDFVLSTPGRADVAVFTDGFAYHATLAHNRVGDDATKRSALIDQAYQVLAVTAEDCLLEEQGGNPATPKWWNENVSSQLMQGFAYNRDAVAGALGGPFAWLRAWLQGADPAGIGKFADAVPLMVGVFAGAARPISDDAPLPSLAARLLDDANLALPPGDGSAWWWRHGEVGVLVRSRAQTDVDIAVVLDDRAFAMAGPGYRESWRAWLSWTTLLQGRRPELVTSLTTYSVAVAAPALTAPVLEQRLVGAWGGFAKGLPPAASALLAELAERGVRVPDGEAGDEIGAEQIPVDLHWEHERIAVLWEPTDEDVADLAAEGWRVVAADADAIVAALKEAVSG